MILTFYYMYATFVQWWRLGTLRQKLNGTLNKQNALLLCSSTNSIGHADSSTKKQHQRSLENLLYQCDGRIACTIVPRQKLHLSQWAAFPKDRKCFPIHYGSNSSSKPKSTSAKFHLLLQASLENVLPRKIDIIKMEKFGELFAWRANEYFEVILKTDLERVTILLNSFRFHCMGVNHDLPLVKIEMVDVDGVPGKVKYDRRLSKFKFSHHGPAQFRQFTTQLRELYTKVNENLKPKITIENGTTSKSHEHDRKPISEVKPIKKQTSKNTLDVHHGGTGAHKKIKTKQEVGKKEEDLTTQEVEKVAKTEEKPKEKEKEKEKEKKHKEHRSSKSRDVTDASANKSKKHEESKSTPEEKTKEKDDGKIKKKEKNKIDARKKAKEAENVSSPVSTSNVPESQPPKASLDVVKKTYSDVAASPGSGKNLQRQNATSSKETSPNRAAKPPNILVYADTSLAKENVKSVLKMIINKDKYTVYDFPTLTTPGQSQSQFWNSTTTLVIVCGGVSQTLTPHLLDYLVAGGQLLCLCSDLLYSVLHPFSTAEVREHELVRFTYGEWKRVKMMHHIFCYQASPAKKQFSRDSSDTSMNGAGSAGSSPVAPRTPSIVDIQHNGQKYTIQVQVLGAEETWQTPSLLLATVRGNNGKAVFSQVHLEVDPMQYQDDESKYAALKDSNQARLEILKHILSNHLDIDCSCKSSDRDVVYGPGYFLGRHDLKMQLLNESSIVDCKIQMRDLDVQFYAKNVEPPEASASKLPIMVLRCPTNFSTVEYFDTLQTERVGRLVIYADVLASSQRVLAAKLCDGLAVIPRRQTEGKGRSGNVWLSPEGCAMFSLQLHVPLESHLGKSLPLVQQLVMVAVVKAVRKASGIENIQVGLKWPNDLYAYGNIKIGGLIASSILGETVAVVSVGCGINLDNREPTICINDMIKELAKDKSPISAEKFFASTFNEVEDLVDTVQAKGIDYLLDLCYQYWLHSDANIIVTTSDGLTKNVMIRGLDTYGYLQVEDEHGTLSSVQPDGNTFDMLRGLIAPKLSS